MGRVWGATLFWRVVGEFTAGSKTSPSGGGARRETTPQPSVSVALRRSSALSLFLPQLHFAFCITLKTITKLYAKNKFLVFGKNGWLLLVPRLQAKSATLLVLMKKNLYQKLASFASRAPLLPGRLWLRLGSLQPAQDGSVFVAVLSPRRRAKKESRPKPDPFKSFFSALERHFQRHVQLI